MKPIKMVFTDKWTSELKEKIDELEFRPKLEIFHCNHDKATSIYLKNKVNYAKKLDVEVSVKQPKTATELYDLMLINNSQHCPAQVMLQQPAPKNMISMFKHLLNDYADNELDIEAVNQKHQLKLKQRAIKGIGNVDNLLLPCTVAGNLKLIEEYLPGFSYDGKVALVIGRSEITGTPMAEVLECLNCTVIKANSRTKNLDELCKLADIIVSCVGKPNLVTTCKPGAVLIDNGVSLVKGHQCGDISKDCWHKSLAYTPWIGATGKATVHCLFENMYKNEKNIENI